MAAAASVAGLDSCSSGVAYQSKISKLATEIQPRVLVSSNGSGNHGESGMASFYTIDKLPIAFQGNATITKLELSNIDLGKNRQAFIIDHVLTHEEADILAACAEAVLEENGHSRLAPGIHTPPGMRINEAAHWYPSHTLAPKLLGAIYERIRPLVPDRLDGRLPLHPRLSEKVAHFKYNQGDQFHRHTDGLFPGQGANEEGTGVDEWIGVISGFSMLFYLNDKENDGLMGGETRLWEKDGSRYVDVNPKKGRVLIFRRGSRDAVLHAGLPVTGEVPKYMALMNLAYGEQTGTRPLL
eukprot:CAMPEP_0194217068 /NCGR_PEP_ID=MMETSP0156-20130528/20256_1 /TAXON_ID=33649 /ORGANISM="Thalassionema nitzschioides, Strain L26-B" /LENGTH=296 /DNA_ID=CAMNT_0038945997 /DNA_START=101 /DNA_END=991 /DNA_ORIENTATION=+